MKYLGLIDAVTLLYQYQRPIKEVEHRGQRIRYIEVTKEDIAVANRLAHEVLGRSLDELPPQTRRLLGLLDSMVTAESERLGVERADYRFSRRALREKTGWGDTQLKVHLGRLVEMEYVMVHRGAGHSQRFGYELVYEKGGSDGPFLPGLINVSELGRHGYDENRSGLEANRSGQNGNRSGAGRPLVGVRSVGGRGDEVASNQHQDGSNREQGTSESRKAHRGNGASKSVVVPSSQAYPRAVAAS
jgi:DNA primase